jgi:hypothetical protein
MRVYEDLWSSNVKQLYKDPSAVEWAESAEKTVGDQVYIDSDFDRGLLTTHRFYFQCIADHTTDSDNQPISGADWTDYWTTVGDPIVEHYSGNKYPFLSMIDAIDLDTEEQLVPLTNLVFLDLVLGPARFGGEFELSGKLNLDVYVMRCAYNSNTYGTKHHIANKMVDLSVLNSQPNLRVLNIPVVFFNRDILIFTLTSDNENHSYANGSGIQAFIRSRSVNVESVKNGLPVNVNDLIDLLLGGEQAPIETTSDGQVKVNSVNLNITDGGSISV